MQRQCLFLPAQDSQLQLQALLNTYSAEKSIFLGQQTDLAITTYSHKQSQQLLGKEFELVVFDAREQFHPDSFGAVVGTIVAGGLLAVLVGKSDTPYLKRFYQLAQTACQQFANFHWLDSEQQLPLLEPLKTFEQQASQDQLQTVAAINKVVTGHRRRPLVISSDRGRGKTAALGMAAAELLKSGKQKIIVTAPSLKTVDTLFKHAEMSLMGADLGQGHLNYKNSQIVFYAPDTLLDSSPDADLVMVDEAAAIPTSMLELLVKRYSRIVFATTLHGYEGTGRGFAIRFQQKLDELTPNWRSIELNTPIRWLPDDTLEQFSFQSLMLDAEPVDAQCIEDVNIDACEFEQLDPAVLAQNEHDLRQLFGLMVLAHYRTRPSDLQMLLDRDDVSIYILRYQGHIVATTWLVKEGKLDRELSQAVYNGTRRLNGHLLPQSLLAHAGLADAGDLSYQRIIRIGVHPAVQQRGLGQHFLNLLQEHIVDVDCLGASFSAQDNLISFWNKAGFQAVRLGQKKDDVAGEHSLMMLKACSDKGRLLIDGALARLQQQWPFLLQHTYRNMNPSLLMSISKQLSLESSELSEAERCELVAFAESQRAYEACLYSLSRWALWAIQQSTFDELSSADKQLVFMLLLQQRDMSELVQHFGFNGRKDLIFLLRKLVASLLPS